MDVFVRLVTLGLALLVVSWGGMYAVSSASADGDVRAPYAAARDDVVSSVDDDADDDGDDGDASWSLDDSHSLTTGSDSLSLSRSMDTSDDAPRRAQRQVSRDSSHDRATVRKRVGASKSRDHSRDLTTGGWSRGSFTSGD